MQCQRLTNGPGRFPEPKPKVMKTTRALTASEATAKLFEMGFTNDWNKTNWIADNEFTLPFGKTNFTYANPRVNSFGPELISWDTVGVRYSVEILEDSKGNSNIFIYRWNNGTDSCIASYNKMKAAEKKSFMEMLEKAVLIDWPAPQTIRNGFRDASYKDENGVHHSAFYAPDGKFVSFANRHAYLNFYPGEHYEYNGKPFIRK